MGVRRRDIRKERIQYAAYIRRFIVSELGFLNKQKVLDAGCGTGLVSRILKKLYPKIKLVGIDNYKKDINEARRKSKNRGLGIRYMISSLDEIPLPNKSFDVIIATLVMHHMSVETRIKTLKESYRLLNKNGRLIILEGKGLTKGLENMMRDAGFDGVQSKEAGKIRKVYFGTKPT